MARVARLGITIDSSGAVTGANATRTALDTVSATASRAQASVTAATQAVTRSGVLQAAAAAQATQATTVASASTARHTAALLENTLASGTGTVSAKSLAAAWAAEAAAERAATSVSVAHTGAIAATTAATGAATVATGALSGVMATLGGPIGIALIAGMTAVQFIMGKVGEETAKAGERARQAEKDFKALTEAQLSNQLSTLVTKRAPLESQLVSAGARGDLVEYQRLAKEIATLNEPIGKVTDAIVKMRREKDAAKSSVGALAASMADAEAELRAFRTGGESAARVYRLAATAWSASSDGIRTLEAALKAGDPAAKALVETARSQIAAETTLSRLRKESTEVVKRKTIDIDKLREALERQAKAEREVERGKEFKSDVQNAIASLDARRKAERAISREKAVQYLAAAEEIAQLEFRVSLIGKTRTETEKLTDEETRRLAIARGMTAEQAQQVVDLQRQLRNAKQDTDSWADALRGVVGVVQLIASAFGDAGLEVVKVGNAAQSLLGGLDAAGKLKGRDGTSKIGLGTALSGSEGAGAFADGLSVVGQYAGAAIALADAFGLFDDAAKRAREGQVAYNKALEEYAIVQRTSLEQRLRENIAGANQAAQGAFAASGTTGSVAFKDAADLTRIIAQLRQGPPAFASLANELAKLLPIIEANEAAIRREAAIRLQSATEDLAVRRLVAAGNVAAADAERLRLTQLREVREAENEFGDKSPYIEELKKVQAAETAAAQAAADLAEAERILTQQRQGAAFGGDLTARRQTLSGDTRGAFVTRAGISGASELAAAEALLKAGTITQAMFDELARILNDELAAALREMEAAARAAAEAVAAERQAKFDDLAVRELVAKGDENGAARLRRELENKKELEGVNDIVLMGEILRVQALEEQAIALAELARIEAERAAQNDDITRRMIDAYRIIDPAKAAELEQIREQIEREELLRNAVDDATRARYEELFAIEDQAKALQKLADEQRKAAEAAEKLANLTATVEEEWLRSTGRGFDADVKALERRRDERIEEAKKAGASEETIRQIKEIFNANYAALIASTFESAAKTLTTSPLSGDVEYQTRAVTRSISGQEALRLIDVATSQLTVLRQIAANTAGGGAGGVTVEVSVQGGVYQQSPESVGAGIVSAVEPLLDQAMGRRTGVQRILTGKQTL